MLYHLFCLLCLFCVVGNAQEGFKLYYEATSNGYIILADNEEFSPVSAHINFSLENLSSSQGNDKVFVVPAKIKRHLITELAVIKRGKRMKLGMETIYNFGDHTLKTFDKNFKYYLPFPKGKEFWLSQGYNGAISHQGENALDFKMPMGTKIHAARGGVVVDIEEGYSRSCTASECAKYNNYIVIYHNDGTFAEYTHIRKNGAKVEVGDVVQIGEFIGYSGDVGWATGPHLHFIVFLQKLQDRETLPTQFIIDANQNSTLLKEKEKYIRMY